MRGRPVGLVPCGAASVGVRDGFPAMFMARKRPATTVTWFVAVLGAGAVLISPITPVALLVDVLGLATCVVASGVLAATFFRR